MVGISRDDEPPVNILPLFLAPVSAEHVLSRLHKLRRFPPTIRFRQSRIEKRCGPFFWPRAANFHRTFRPGIFAAALIDLAARGPDVSLAGRQSAPLISVDVLEKNIPNLGNPAVQQVFFYCS